MALCSRIGQMRLLHRIPPWGVSSVFEIRFLDDVFRHARGTGQHSGVLGGGACRTVHPLLAMMLSPLVLPGVVVWNCFTPKVLVCEHP